MQGLVRNEFGDQNYTCVNTTNATTPFPCDPVTRMLDFQNNEFSITRRDFLIRSFFLLLFFLYLYNLCVVIFPFYSHSHCLDTLSGNDYIVYIGFGDAVIWHSVLILIGMIIAYRFFAFTAIYFLHRSKK
jgi:hypothetical protein